VPLYQIGQTVADARLRIATTGTTWLIDAPLAELKEAWQKPLRW